MFTWCAYCQRLIGETEPLSKYTISHGVCESCQKTVATYTPQRSTLVARDLFAELTRLGARGALEDGEPFVRSAIAAGLRPSEILVGLLHPALGDLGERWERGEISVADEHRFTAFASRVLELVPVPSAPEGAHPPIVLTLLEGNEHDIGIRMLQRVAIEQGHPCTSIHPALPEDAILSLAEDLRPRMLGLSVSLPEMIPSAVEAYRRLNDTAACHGRVVLGGYAFRQARPPVPEDIRVIRSIDGFLAAIHAPRRGPATDARD